MTPASDAPATGSFDVELPVFSGPFKVLADLILELHRWLSRFDTRSLLELDYAGLCDLVTWDEMDDDHSAREIHEALAALSSGELTRSAELYQATVSRTAELRSRESLS